MAARQHMMRATFHHPPNIEVVSVQKARDRNPKQILGAKLLFDDASKKGFTCRLCIRWSDRRKEGRRDISQITSLSVSLSLHLSVPHRPAISATASLPPQILHNQVPRLR